MVKRRKKTLKKRLDASSKNRRAEALIGCLDELGRCRRRLAALAGMMLACGEAIPADHIREIGMLMAGEMCRLGKLKDTLERETR